MLSVGGDTVGNAQIASGGGDEENDSDSSEGSIGYGGNRKVKKEPVSKDALSQTATSRLEGESKSDTFNPESQITIAPDPQNRSSEMKEVAQPNTTSRPSPDNLKDNLKDNVKGQSGEDAIQKNQSDLEPQSGSEMTVQHLLANQQPDSLNPGDANSVAKKDAILPIKNEPLQPDHSTTDLIDTFLDIPIEDFLPIDKTLKFELFSRAKRNLSEQGSKKLHAMMTMSVLSWLKVQDKLAVKEKFLEAHRFASTEGLEKEFTRYFEQWSFMHIYKDVLESKNSHLSESKIAELTTVLYDCSHTHIFNDLFSLKLLYNIRALPHLESLATIEQAFVLLPLYVGRLKDTSSYTPVSFTAQDNIRFLYPSESTIKTLLLSSEKLDGTDSLLLVTILTYLSNLSEKKEGYAFSIQAVIQFAVNAGWETGDVKGFLSIFNEFVHKVMIHVGEKNVSNKSEIENFYQRNEKVIRGHTGTSYCQRLVGLVALANYFQAIIEEYVPLPRTSTRVTHMKVAKRHTAVAAQWPGSWHSVFIHYKKANLPDLAANAASQLALHWQPINGQLAEYWTDVALSLTHPTDNSDTQDHEHTQACKTSSKLKKNKKDVAANKKQKSKTKATPGTKKTGTLAPAITPTPVRELTAQSLSAISVGTATPRTGQPQIGKLSDSACQTPSTLTAPVIKANSKQENKVDFTIREQDGWSVMTQGKALPAFNRLRYDNWNPKVKSTLKNIHKAREDDNPEAELKVINEILSDSKHKIMIGIERIWEEATWTRLHPYDDAFASGLVRFSLSQKAREDAKEIREKFALPALAHRLAMDEVNSQTDPQELYERAEQVLSWAEYSDKDSQSQLRHRLRCLFSTIGHTYSLEAMASPSKSKSLGDKARSWFGFKRIDPNYVTPHSHH